MTDQVRKLKDLVDGSGSIVFFGGAGVSTESGIPTSAAPAACTTSSGNIRLR